MKALVFLLSLLVWQVSWAQSDIGEEYIDYDSIINRLSQPQTSYTSYSGDPFDLVKIHVSVGVINTINSVTINDKSYRPNFSGMQMTLGIDLFSRYWRAEGGMRNFNPHQQDEVKYKYREFDLKLVYHSPFAKKWAYYLGAGVAARYLESTYAQQNSEVSTAEKPTEPGNASQSAPTTTQVKTDSTTPASLLLGGVSFSVNKTLSIDTEVSFRNAMIKDTLDKSGFDFALKASGHF